MTVDCAKQLFGRETDSDALICAFEILKEERREDQKKETEDKTENLEKATNNTETLSERLEKLTKQRMNLETALAEKLADLIDR